MAFQHPEEARLTGHQALIGQIFGWPATTGYVWKACKTLRFGVLMDAYGTLAQGCIFG